jgi:2-oxoglutarate dehydrogenase E1 component
VDRRLERAIGTATRVGYAGRPESPSPAGSFHGEHDRDQQRIIAAAFED